MSQQGLTMDGPRDWFHDEEFDIPLPASLSHEVARFYGRGRAGTDFAQALAAFIDVEQCRVILRAALDEE